MSQSVLSLKTTVIAEQNSTTTVSSEAIDTSEQTLTPRRKGTMLVVDDEELARRSLIAALGAEHDVEILAEASNGLEALERIGEHEPDVVARAAGTHQANSPDASFQRA